MINIQFTEGEALLLAQLLRLCLDRWMRCGCNDFSLKEAGLTEEQITGLIAAMNKVGYDDEPYSGDNNPDFVYVGHFKCKMLQALKMTDKDLPEIP